MACMRHKLTVILILLTLRPVAGGIPVLAPGQAHLQLDLHNEVGRSNFNFPWEEEPKESTTQQCRMPNRVDSSSDKWEGCPEDCPLYAEVDPHELHCYFECVGNSIESCKERNPRAPIPDKEMGICRSCMVEGCKVCATDGTDTCVECNANFVRIGNKRCQNKFMIVWVIVFVVLGALVVWVGLWLGDLAWRPIVNSTGLQQGLTLRSRAKLAMPYDEEERQRERGVEVETVADSPAAAVTTATDTEQPEEAQGIERRNRSLWPLKTNLLTTRVAGPGLMLQFNLQYWIIIWAAIVAVAWLITASFYPDLFRLGTRRAQTPRQNCILVAWGYEVQHDLMWVKVAFCVAVYIFSFIGCIWFSIRQLRMFQLEDAQETTHKDFCAVLEGLPQISGHDHVEEEIAELLTRSTGVDVVGVSICWDFAEQDGLYMSVLESDLCDREHQWTSRKDRQSAKRKSMEGDSRTFLRKAVDIIEDAFLSPTAQKILTKGKKHVRNHKQARHTGNRGSLRASKTGAMDVEAMPVMEVNVQESLWLLKTTHKAFVVFNSEKDRDDAVALVEENGGMEFRESDLILKECKYEPNSVQWRNVTNETLTTKVVRALKGFAVIILALNIWIFVFYLPYAILALNFNYSYGQEPGFVESMSFSMLVVAGNAAMYLICAEVADYIGFESVDDREVCYMLLYNFACVFNVVLDIAITYVVAFEMMKGQDMRTYDGKHLKDVNTFEERVETYAMQREMGRSLWSYSFPSTFLLPFLIEPILTIYLPYKLSSWVVRSNTKFRSFHAERNLASTPMDLSRYADVLLNVILAVLIFFFPGGFTLQMFAMLAVSHVYIYGYDHYRVLRSIPQCEFASLNVDWWAQWLLTVPCGIIIAAAVYKWAVDTKHHTWGYGIVYLTSAAFIGHVLVHTALLVWFVPLLGRSEKEPSTKSYAECSRRLAQSWFSANPVHCLRSSFIYKHDPPCDFCMAGKEHLLRKNEAIGVYFDDQAMEAEDFNESIVDMSSVARSLSLRFSKKLDDEEEAPLSARSRIQKELMEEFEK